MNLPWLAARNLSRNRTRVFLTILGVAVAVVIFLLLRTVVWAWTFAAETGAKDRIGTRHKVSFILQLPKHYIEKVRTVPGVTAATWMNWMGAKDPRDENNFFQNLAVDHTSFLDVYSEIVISPEAKERWMSDPQGALVGDVLAKKWGVKEGDKIILKGTIYPGDWEFHVSGIYQVTAKTWDRSSVLFRWDYFNNKLPERRRDEIGWIMARIDNPRRSGEVSAAIDKIFDERDIQTLSMSEKQLNNQFIAMFEAILFALDVVSLVIMAILMLILGNTIAMGVRERTTEYGVLRAIGFLPKHVAGFILSEGLFIGLLGGLAGLALGSLLISGVGKFVEEGPMAGFFPYFRLQPLTVGVALALSSVLGVVAAFIPAYRASRLQVTDALRKVG
jgi:putative ABC transport system permease protein